MPASSNRAIFASTSWASGSFISIRSSSTSAADSKRPPTGRPLAEAIAYAQRACAACAVTNAVAYAQACEAALGLAPDRELRRARTLLLELERVYNHLHDISAICAGVGYAPGTMTYAALKERAQRVNARVTGHRFLFDNVRLGVSELAARARWRCRRASRAPRDTRRALRELAPAAVRALAAGAPVGVGVLAREDAERLGAVGPAARAAGVRRDVRSESPGLSYSAFRPVTPAVPAGDVASRMAQRALELEQSLDLLDELLAGPLGPGRSRAAGNAATPALASRAWRARAAAPSA